MHFVIVSYTFPPSKEIGGRRWAKFSQHLVKAGHVVTVVTSQNASNLEANKREFPNTRIIQVPKRYPDWLSGYTKTLFEKILYLIVTKFLGVLTKRNIYDRGIAWEKQMLQRLEEIHSGKQIDVLVATGGPFSLVYYGSKFKKRYPGIFFVMDLRDPWTWGSLYGMLTLSNRKKRFQEYCEQDSIESSDMVCYPTSHMGKILKENYPESSHKMYLLPHAFDPDKFPARISDEQRKGFIYGGTIYDGIETYLKKFAEIVSRHPENNFTWDVYTGRNASILRDLFKSNSVKVFPLVDEATLFERIAASKVYLVFFPIADKDLVSTKFFEIIYSGTPILYIGEEGEVGKFIRENKVGVHILPSNLEKELPVYLSGKVPHKPGFFQVEKFTFHEVTKAFLDELGERIKLINADK